MAAKKKCLESMVPTSCSLANVRCSKHRGVESFISANQFQYPTLHLHYIYLSGYPCKLQLKYFNVVKSAILISASQRIRYSRQNLKQNNNKHKH